MDPVQSGSQAGKVVCANPGGSVGCCGGSCSVRAILLGGLVILVLAVSARFVGLGRLDLWGDEVYSYIASIDVLPNLLRWDTAENQAHSPLPFIEMKIARAALGKSDFTSRVPAALYSTGAVVGFYWFVGVRVGWGAAFWGAMLLALNPFALEWGREARMYSNWLFYTLVIAALADGAIGRVRRGEAGGGVDWRWWLLGVAFMLVHASNVHAAVTVAGTVGVLGLIAVVEVFRVGRAGWEMMLGACISSLVFVTSWSLTGIGKLLHYLTAKITTAEGVERDAPRGLVGNIDGVMKHVGGYLPTWWSLVLWGIAAVGLVIAVRKKRVELVLLFVAAAVSPFINYPTLTKNLWFTGRYVFASLLALSLGFGVCAAWMWSGGWCGRKWLSRSALVIVLGVTGVLWWPVYREIFLVPKMAIRQALAPVVKSAVKGEVFVMVPDWYASLGKYYQFSDRAMLIRPPRQGRYAVLASDKNPGKAMKEDIKPFEGDFEELYSEEALASGRVPPAAWVFLVFQGGYEERESAERKDVDRMLKQIGRLLAAYRLDDEEHRAAIKKAAGNSLTLTMRLSEGKFDQVVTTVGRKNR